jgi:hypothetical protein
MHNELLKQIIKLETFAEMVKAECVKTRELMEKPATQRVVNNEKRIALKRIELRKRLTAKR